MKLNNISQLVQHLKPVAGAYLISGDEPLLVQEACDLIRAAAREQGFEERQVFHVEANFNWQSVLDEANAMSLFSSRKVLEIRLNAKPSDKGQALKELTAQPNPDNLILVISPRLDAATQKTAWVKALEQQGVWLPIWPIERNNYLGWLQQRCQKAGLTLERNALDLLAQQTEGNLLAAVQEIEKLSLLKLSNIDLATLEQAIGNSARFDAFGLADACLLGNIADASRMLNGLKAEGTEAIMILGALLRKIHQLFALKSTPSSELATAFKQQGIWPKQQAPFKQALHQLSISDLNQALRKCEQIDHAVKGSGEDPWRLLHELILLLSNKALFLH